MSKANCDICLKNKLDNGDGYLVPNQIGDFLCNDCEKYLCSNCFTDHVDHVTISVNDKSNKNKLDQFCGVVIEKLKLDEDNLLEKFTQERTHICDVVDAGAPSTWEFVCDLVDMGAPISLGDGTHVREFGNERQQTMIDICILRESKKWAVADYDNNCIRVFNINNNKKTHSVNLKDKPCGIREIPSTKSSPSLIAFSLQSKQQISLMNIHSTQAQVVSNINVQGKYYDLAYCNNKIIGLCCDYLDVVDMSGEIINVINLPKLPNVKRHWDGRKCMSVHSETETIYVGHEINPSCVISMSVNGQLLNYVIFTDLKPCIIHVDKDQTVFVTDKKLPLYKLSSNLSQTDTALNETMIVDMMQRKSSYFTSIACHADTFYLARSDGFVVIIRHE